MTSGQGDLGLAPTVEAAVVAFAELAHAPAPERRRVLRASDAELALHLARLARIAKKAGGRVLWPADDESTHDPEGAAVALRG